MNQEFIELKGNINGPISIIVVGVHGNEACGVFALEELLPTLKINAGTVWFCLGNPLAFDREDRQVDVNLNRLFREELTEEEKNSYEFGRMQFLKQYLDRADALLDVHASFTPEAKPFVICEDNAFSVVSHFPVDLVVSGFDEHEPGGTDYYMNKLGKIGICVECGYFGDQQSTANAKKSILAFLQMRGHLPLEQEPREQSKIRIFKLYKTKTANFVLEKQFADFEPLGKGQLIGMDGSEEIRAEKDCQILFALSREERGKEAFLLAGVEEDGRFDDGLC
jgi:succinylglutamate desuccinylase